MNREVLDKWLERGILGIVLAILIYAPLALGAVRPTEFLVVQALVIAGAVLWGVRLWVSPEPKLFWPPISWAVLAFAGYAVARYFFSDIEYVARLEMIRVLVYCFLFFAITNNVRRAETAQVVVVSLVIVASGIAAYSIFQFLTRSPNVWVFSRPMQYLSRSSGTFINPNHLSGFLELVLPLAVALTLLGRFKHVSKIFLGYAGLVILVGIGFTVSRGGWIVTGVILIGMLVMLFKKSGSKLKIAAIFMLMVAISLAFLNASWFERRVQQSYSSGRFDDIRPWIWQSAVQLWKEDPWIGIGPGHFDYRYGKYRQASNRVQMRPEYVHNDYLNALTDWGVVGVTIILGSFVLLGQGLRRTWDRVSASRGDLNRRSSNREAILLGAAFGVLAILLHSVVDFNLQIPANAMLFVALMALMTSFRRYESQPFSNGLNFIGKTAVSALLIALAFYLSQEGIRRWDEQKALRLAETLAGEPEKQLAALKSAHAAEPRNPRTVYQIGELLRKQSWQGNADYQEKALEAMKWFLEGMQLNPYSPYNYVRYGMCLDWLGEHEKAFAFFDKALEVDPHNHFVLNYMGWHFMQVHDYETAKKWFTRSWQIYDNHNNRNPVPGIYLQMIERRLNETDAEPVLDIPPQ